MDAAPEDVAEMLTMAGLEVEETEDLGDDTLYVAEVTSNRPDWLGVIGIARELSALTGKPLELPAVDFDESGASAEEETSVTVEAPGLCPRYTARVIRNVKVGPSPEWLARLIERVGLRPVNNVVDITNFVLFECCQPLHTFDLDKLDGRRVVVRRAKDGESIVAIDGSERKVTPENLVIADKNWPVAIAGVMGGLDTEIGEDTTNILLESAQFDPINNRRTARALDLHSDSSYRFERGVDPVNVEWASRRCAHLLQTLCGGEVAPGVIDVQAKPFAPCRVAMRVARMNKLLGMDVPCGRAARILEALGCKVLRRDSKVVEVEPPPWRADLEREADLIEEVVRIVGLGKVPVATSLPVVARKKTDRERASEAAGAVMVGAGYFEALTTSFQTESDSKLVSPWTDAKPLVFNNVVRREENRLRVSILPELLRLRRLNDAHGVERVKAWEISKVYLPREGRDLPEERAVLSLVSDDDLLSVKGVVESVFEALRVRGVVEFEAIENPFFDEGMAAQATLDGERVAVLGRVSAAAADRFDLPRRPCVAEVDFDRVLAAADFVPRHEPLPAFPASARDFAVIVDEDTQWTRIKAVVEDRNIPILEALEFFDIYRGKQVPKGKKSVAFRLVFRAPDRTLTREEVDEYCEALVAALAAQLDAELRG